MKKSYIILFVLFLLFLNKTLYADYNQCLDYFKKGDFNSSFNECKDLALKGNTNAINHLAYMFYKGIGVKKNIDTAILLYKTAILKSNLPLYLKSNFNIVITCLAHYLNNNNSYPTEIR